jgi:hypothetical protein
MRRVVIAAALVFAGSCGGSSPTSPGGATVQPRAVSLPAGPYTLAVGLSPTGLPVCQNGVCSSTSLCVGNPVATDSQFDVTLERSGDDATARVAGSGTQLLLTLRLASASVTGSIAGGAINAAGAQIAATGVVTGAAPGDPTIAVSGNIDGQVSVSGAGCTNNGHTWSLRAR